MNYTAQWISYDDTNAFSALAIDYLNQHASLQSFFKHTPTAEGISKAIEERKLFGGNRQLLVSALTEQYTGIEITEKVKTNIHRLGESNTFTICTAHQPNLFTGYLYFIYKILHTIKLSDELNDRFPEYHFVPVYYMGSEDNDLEELNRINLNGDKLIWNTKQTGAVGRMNPKGTEALIEQIKGQLSIYEHGDELVTLLKKCYGESSSIQDATLKLVNHLFKDYGLVVLIPDNSSFKKQMTAVFEDDLFNHTPEKLVHKTAERLSRQYHAQVNPREINLFYLNNNIRERIIKSEGQFKVNNTALIFSPEEMRKELHTHPERFSPNVVLRGLYQETLLPNIAFIGGGSEIAYWLELKDVFEHYKVPYPVLLLRNSFLIAEKKMTVLMQKLNVSPEALFKDEQLLLNDIIKEESGKQLVLENEIKQAASLYDHIREVTMAIDSTLTGHVNAIEARIQDALKNLEKKMMRAERKKHEAQSAQLHKLKSSLFPGNTLQERVENILPYYAVHGKSFINMLYTHSPSLNQQFGILLEN